MTESLGVLLTGSWKFFRSHIKPILLGALLFGVLTFGVQKFLEQKTTGYMGQRFGDIEQMQDLAERLSEGDEEAFQEMMMQIGMMGEGGEMDEEAMGIIAKDMMGNMLPAFGLFFLSMMLLSLLSSTFYIVLAVDGSQDAMASLRRLPGLILPMFGVWVWSFLRSFAWIPVVGVLCAIVIGPRLALSSVILVKEKQGVRESVRSSYTRTRGYWGKIVGNCIVASVLVMAVMMFLSIGIALIGTGSALAAAIVGAILQSAMTAYVMIFLVKLTTTISDHPIVTTTVKK